MQTLTDAFGDPVVIHRFLNQFPGPACWHEMDHSIYATNNLSIKLTGFKRLEQIIGLTKHSLRCKLANQAELYIRQDQQVMDKKEIIKGLSYKCFAGNEWKVIFSTKSPIVDSVGNMVGVAQYFNEVKDLQIQKLCIQLAKINHYIKGNHQQQVCYDIRTIPVDYGLTTREYEIYMLHGKTENNIASLLCRSRRTIETHIESIKNKYSVANKSQLIEQALSKGHLGIIPESLFNRSINIAINEA